MFFAERLALGQLLNIVKIDFCTASKFQTRFCNFYSIDLKMNKQIFYTIALVNRKFQSCLKSKIVQSHSNNIEN